MSSKFEEVWRGFKYLQMQIAEWETEMNTKNDFATRRSGLDRIRLTLNQLVQVIEKLERED
jgi:hypothetical protein